MWAERLSRKRKVQADRQGQRHLLCRTGSSLYPRIHNRSYVSFCSNDYLGLSQHPRVIHAAKGALDAYGVGSNSSALISGYCAPHQKLERALAIWTQRDAALLFSSGYLANLGVLSTLCRRQDCVVQDRENHASLIDGARLAGATLKRYRGADDPRLKGWLCDTKRQTKLTSLTLLATDAVFSMGGHHANLPKLAAYCKQSQALCFVDDTHGLGHSGPKGRGTLAHYQLNQADVPLMMAGLGKTFGAMGAFVAGTQALIEDLRQTCRTYIYTTALSPVMAASASAVLRLIQTEPHHQACLEKHITSFKKHAQANQIALTPSRTAIQCLPMSTIRQALWMEQHLREHGYLARTMRPPTVAPDAICLRFSLNANHREADIARLFCVLKQGFETCC